MELLLVGLILLGGATLVVLADAPPPVPTPAAKVYTPGPARTMPRFTVRELDATPVVVARDYRRPGPRARRPVPSPALLDVRGALGRLSGRQII